MHEASKYSVYFIVCCDGKIYLMMFALLVTLVDGSIWMNAYAAQSHENILQQFIRLSFFLAPPRAENPIMKV